jgi:hypothetical protein
MRKKKIWFVGVTHEGNLKHLKELINPIKDCFNGLIWTFHYPKDLGADYLESLKGEGKIIYADWCNRLDYSRNHCLYQGPMQMGDWFFTVDCHERISRDFGRSLKKIANSLDEEGIDGIFLHGKRFAAKVKEETEFSGNPHEGITGITKAIEITQTDFWKDSFFQNIRQSSRDKFAIFISAMKYYIFPQTNHLFLHFEEDKEFISFRYEIRLRFLNEITKLGFNAYCLDSVRSCIKKHLTDELIKCINSEKILNDWYRYEFLGAEDLIDKHDFSLIKKI